MRKLDEPILIAIACAVIGVAISGVAILSVLAQKGADPSALVRMSEAEPLSELARSIDPGFEFVPPAAHYDGVYFYAIAIDPFATKTAHTLIDLSPARYSHAGYGWMAWVFSLGRPESVPTALVLVGLLSIGAASAIGSVISNQLGQSAWGGLFVALNPGLIYSVTADTSEPFGALLLGLLFLAWRSRRWILVGLLSVALSLTKEIFLILLFGFFVWRCLKALRDRSRERLIAPLIALSTGPVVWIAWQIYLHSSFDGFAFSETPKLIYFPLTGWVDALTIAAGLGVSTADSAQVGQASVPLLCASAGLLAIGIFKAARLRNVFDSAYLFVAVFTFCYGPLQLVYPKDWIRLGSTAFLLLPAVLFMHHRPYESYGLDYPEPVSDRATTAST